MYKAKHPAAIPGSSLQPRARNLEPPNTTEKAGKLWRLASSPASVMAAAIDGMMPLRLVRSSLGHYQNHQQMHTLTQFILIPCPGVSTYPATALKQETGALQCLLCTTFTHTSALYLELVCTSKSCNQMS